MANRGELSAGAGHSQARFHDRSRSPYSRFVSGKWKRAAAGGLVALGLVRQAAGAGPLGPEGTPIRTSAYGVDLFQGPVLATTRITGLAGAFTAIAEGTEGIAWNPTAASVRPAYSTTRDDYDLAIGVTLPASVENTDFDNDGQTGFAYDRFVWVTFGGVLQHGALGFGVIASFQNYELGVPGTPFVIPGAEERIDSLIIRMLRFDPVVSYAALAEQLHVGVGLRVASFFGVGATSSVDAEQEERMLMSAYATGVQSGILWAPRATSVRVGFTARTPVVPLGKVEGRIPPNAEGDRVVGTLYLPKRLELPWELEGGFAVQLWKRHFNLRWADEDAVSLEEAEPHRRTLKNGQREPPWRGARRLLKARHAALPRERVLLSTSVLLSGPVKNAVGVESMLAQVVHRSGERVALTLRAGAEAEVVPTWLVLRAGSYLEPTRFRSAGARVHGTGGFDVRVLESEVFGLYDEGTRFRISGAVDAARDYFGWSIGVGLFR
jgi:hypothetical protein